MIELHELSRSVSMGGRELVILHMFAKKTRTMPWHEIAVAERRRRDWLRREVG